MRIAVSYDYGQIAPRFSADQRFKVYDVSNNCVGHQSVVSTIGDNDTAARALSTLGVDTLICGSIRDSAKNAFFHRGRHLRATYYKYIISYIFLFSNSERYFFFNHFR